MKIKELIIYTQHLDRQTCFYTDVIGLELIAQTEKYVSFKVGSSVLNLVQSELTTPYHFAINIPSNKENEALAWLKERVEILKDGTNEIHDFNFWNAKAMYFYDADRNIVEFIAHKNLRNASEDEFGVKALLGISEIGVPVNDIETIFNTLKDIAGLEQFSGSFDRFCTIGNPHGLFICVDKNRKEWFPTGDKAFSSAFQIRFEYKDNEYSVEFANEVLQEIEDLSIVPSININQLI